MSCSATTLEMVSHHGTSTAELAELYSEISNVQKEHGKELIEKLLLEKSMKILDLGCGTGYLSALLADSVWDQQEKWWQLTQTRVDLSLQENSTRKLTWCSLKQMM